MAKASKPGKSIDFEQAMGDLEALVEKMEKGEFSLEDSIRQFERGIELARHCQLALKAAEQKVLQLTEKGGEETLHSLDVSDPN